MKVHVLGPHTAHVESQVRLDRRQRCGAVFGDHHLRCRADLEVLPAAPRARSGEALVEPLVVHVRQPRGVEDGQPAVADLGSKRHVLRALGAQHDRDIGSQRVGDRLERLAEAGSALARQRQRVMRAVAGDRLLARPNLAHDVDVLPGAGQRLGERLAVPALNDLRPGHAEPQDVPATGEVIERQRGHRARRRGPRGQLNHRRAQSHLAGRRPPPGQRRVGIRPPRLGGEDRVETFPFRRSDQLTGVIGRLRTPIPEMQGPAS